MIGKEEAFGQLKYEKESRLKKEQVPVPAAQFIDSLMIRNKVKWYKEEGLDRTSFEAKFIKDKSKYSVEFDSEGNLEDVEILVNWKEMNEPLKESILDQLCEDCWKINVQRAQIQYTGDRNVLLSLVKNGETDESYVIRYELVIRCRTRNNTVLYEYLFTDSGQKLSRSEIVFKNASNLEY